MAKTIFLTSAWFGLELGRGAQFFLDLGLRGSRKAPGELQESSRRAPGELQESSRRAPGQPPGELQDSLLQESSRRCDSLMEGSGVVIAQESSRRAPGELEESSRRAPGELQESSRSPWGCDSLLGGSWRPPGELQESSGRAPGQRPGELQEV